jgi:DNA-directed RNA polymerase specialized sigma24 family protein
VVYPTDGRQRGKREKRLSDRDEARKFEQSLLGWLDDAYNLARWLLRDDQDAQDAVQDARSFARRALRVAFAAATAEPGCSRSSATSVTRS